MNKIDRFKRKPNRQDKPPVSSVLKKGDRFKGVEVVSIGARDDGVVRVKGGIVVFVANVQMGAVINVEITEVGTKFARGIINNM